MKIGNRKFKIISLNTVNHKEFVVSCIISWPRGEIFVIHLSIGFATVFDDGFESAVVLEEGTIMSD